MRTVLTAKGVAEIFTNEVSVAEETPFMVGSVHRSSLKANERLLLMWLMEADGVLGRVCLEERKQTHSFANSWIRSDTIAGQHSRVQDVSGLGKH